MAQSIEAHTGRSISARTIDSKKMTYKIRDTSELQEKIDLGKYADVERVVPTSLVVVDLFPKPGEMVPAGTPVILSFMSKDSIKVEDIADLSDEMKSKYDKEDVKKITDDIQSDSGIKKVLEEKTKYSDMSAGQKEVVKKYAEGKGIIGAGATEETVSKVHKDLSFIYGI